jgi:hypothetical protein
LGKNADGTSGKCAYTIGSSTSTSTSTSTATTTYTKVYEVRDTAVPDEELNKNQIIEISIKINPSTVTEYTKDSYLYVEQKCHKLNLSCE